MTLRDCALKYAYNGDLQGNEFGHPEWLDFPREGNKESFHYCRRQWHLADDDLLRYKFLNRWDKAMNTVEEKHHFLSRGPKNFMSMLHICECIYRNCPPDCPEVSFRESLTMYALALNSDHEEFGGMSRIDNSQHFVTFPEGYAGRRNHLCVYIPCRTAIVLEKIE
uniref:Alpha-amylase_C domain-containing protein n=1 Tax=Ascaris lumbricoides TaxID=6252 RepID=A0A0M3IT66_ASCLU